MWPDPMRLGSEAERDGHVERLERPHLAVEPCAGRRLSAQITTASITQSALLAAADEYLVFRMVDDDEPPLRNMASAHARFGIHQFVGSPA